MPGPRKKIRLRDFDYAEPGPYFVTICARNRACAFGDVVDDCVVMTSIGWTVARCWERISMHFDDVATDAFVVMPNHVHGIIWLSTRAGQARPLPVVIGSVQVVRISRDRSCGVATRLFRADSPR